MFPKPEKTKKNISTTSQLDLVETISAEDKLRNKRRILYLSLSVTIGLSLLFWAYHSIGEFFKAPSSILPRITLPSIKSNSDIQVANIEQVLDEQISNLINQDTGKWNIYLHLLPDGLNHFNWSKNTLNLENSEIDRSIEKISKFNPDPNSQIRQSLPQGIDIREIIIENSNQYKVKALATIPQRQIYFEIGVEGGDISKSKDTVLKLVSALYWSIVRSFPPTN